MKTSLALLTLLLSFTLHSAAQGWVQFANTSTTRVSTNSFWGEPATGLISGPVGSYYFGLFVAPTSVRTCTGLEDPNWTFTGLYATNTTVWGRLATAGANPDWPSAVQIPGWAAGAQANFLVRGWSADFGHDWNQVQQELEGNLFPGDWSYGLCYGQSLIGTDIYLAPVGGPYNNVFGSPSAGYIPGFTLNSYLIPEPSTVALAALGVLALASRRRR